MAKGDGTGGGAPAQIHYASLPTDSPEAPPMSTLYLENISEYVEDEDKIVTYKWLSRMLEVPIDAAKRMLQMYVEQNPSVEVTYIVSGTQSTEDQKTFCIQLVGKDELETTKAQLEEVAGVHIFSVQKMKLKNSDSLFSAHYDICKKHLDEYSRWSPIDCDSQSRRKSSGLPSSNKSTPTVSHLIPKPLKTDSKPNGLLESSQTSGSQKPHANAKVAARGKNKKPFFGRTSTKDEKPTSKESVSSEKQEKSVVKDKPIEEKSMTAGEQEKSVNEEKSITTGKQEKSVIKDKPIEEKLMTAGKQEKSVKEEKSITGKQEKLVIKDEPKTNEEQKKSMLKEDPLDTSTSMSPTSSPISSPPKSSSHKMLGFLSDSDVDGGSSDEEPVSKPLTKSNRKRKERHGRAEVKFKNSKGESEGKKRRRVQNLPSDEEALPEEGVGVKKRKRTKKLVPKVHVNEDGEMVTERVWESDSTDASEVDTAPSCDPVPAEEVSAPAKLKKKKQSSLFKFLPK